MPLTTLPAVTVALTQNGHPDHVTIASRTGLAIGAVVTLTSSALSQANLKVQELDGLDVYLWDPATNSPFNATGFLVADGAQLVQAAQDLYMGVIRDFFTDAKDDKTPLATEELAAILTDLLPGGATAASNVVVTNIPAQQHVIVDNQVTFQAGSTQNTGTINAHPQSVPLPLLGSMSAAFTITGTWSGALVFEGSANAGSTWFAIECFSPDAAVETTQSTTTVNGTFQPTRLAGLTHIRVRTISWSSGSASVYVSGTNAVTDTLSTVIKEPGDAVPAYGMLMAGSQGGTTRHIKVLADGSIVIDTTAFTDGSQKTQVTNFPATQAVSAVALPLPAGAATAANQTNGSQLVQLVQGGNTLAVDASGRITVNVNGTVTVAGTVGVSGSVAVTGIFWQAVQPISATSLPLPTGAAKDSTLTDGSQTTQLTGWTRVDANNSTSTPLGANSWFNQVGVFTDMAGWTAIMGSVFADQPGFLYIDESPDGVNYAATGPIPVTPNQLFTMGHTIDSRYYRFRFQNGATPQGAFRLQVMQSKDGISGDQTSMGQAIYPDQKGQLVKAVISGALPPSEKKNGNPYQEVLVDSRGALLVDEVSAHATFGATLVASEGARSVFKATYGLNARTCNIVTANGGSVTANQARAMLQTSAASNGSAKLETREAIRYVPGQGIIARGAPVFNAGLANSRQAWGLLTDGNGFAFGFNGAQFGILVRNNGVDTWIPQSSWNGDDKFDGTGGSGVTFDPTKGSPMQIQMQWLGYGAVRFFIEDPNNGDFVLVHILKFANTSALPSTQKPDLPVRLEVANTGNLTNVTTYIASMGGFAEGASAIPGSDVRFSFTNQVPTSATGARIFAIQNKLTNIFGGVNNNRIVTHVDLISLRDASGGQDAYVQLILNPTLTGAVFADLNGATSVTQTDTASAYTAGSGTVLATFCLAGGTADTLDLEGFDIRLVPGDVLAVVGFAESGTPTVRASLSWHEEN